mmetsp:Transcript_18368/g.35108  ORF Transcript_18368/g.35108 Transcript_18368/m.35108 type:complete len:329 (+) Transcript_18368:62-1048(+)
MTVQEDSHNNNSADVSAAMTSTTEDLREPLLSSRDDDAEEATPGDEEHGATTAVETAAATLPNDPAVVTLGDDRTWWRFTHALGFVLGGLLFTIGTLLYYVAVADADDPAEVAFLGDETAWMYVIGSFGFLYVDVLEFCTFTTPELVWIRRNVACSMVGSTCYVVGSAGFLPRPYAWTPWIGIGGFLAGSAIIGASQAWKFCRIMLGGSSTAVDADAHNDEHVPTADDPISADHEEMNGNNSSGHQNPHCTSESVNAACVEGGACLGGLAFLVGTVAFWMGPDQGDDRCIHGSCENYHFVLALWTLGSLAFLCGGLSLTYRHAVMKIT